MKLVIEAFELDRRKVELLKDKKGYYVRNTHNGLPFTRDEYTFLPNSFKTALDYYHRHVDYVKQQNEVINGRV
jgi:hypothetical protein